MCILSIQLEREMGTLFRTSVAEIFHQFSIGSPERFVTITTASHPPTPSTDPAPLPPALTALTQPAVLHPPRPLPPPLPHLLLPTSHIPHTLRLLHGH